MSKKVPVARTTFLALVFLGLCGGTAYFAYTAPNRSLSMVTNDSKESMLKQNRRKPATVTLTFDAYGFEPNQFREPLGTVVKVKNLSDKPLDFEGLANQPNQLTALNLGNIPAGKSRSFKLSRLGSWQFQANNNPALRGEVSSIPTNNGSKSNAKLTSLELPRYDTKSHSLLINYNDYGFLPNNVTIPKGTKVTVLNSTNEGGMDFEQFPSDPIVYPALSLGVINQGASVSFVAHNPGIYHFVNTWEPTDIGQLTVK